MSLSARVLVRRDAFVLDVDVDVPDGQVVAVLGPNGAGKSTLLRTLAGLVPVDEGVVELTGRTLEHPARGVRVPPERRRVGVVFQDLRLFARLSARENVAFGLRVTGTPRAAARQAADAWLGRLGLGELAQRRPGTLSGGQAQRVALARTLATGPDLLLLDEPLSALDTGTRQDVRAALRAQLATFAGPVLLVTHDLVDVLTLADRVLVLVDGSLVQDDTPRAMVMRPGTAYVAALVGLTLWSGTATGGLLHLDAEHGAGTIALANSLADSPAMNSRAGVALEGPVLAVVSPASVRLRPVSGPGGPQETGGRGRPEVAGGPDDRVTTWTAAVRSVEGLADRVRVQLEGSGAHAAPAVVADVEPAAAAGLPLQPGALLTVELPAGAVQAWAR